MVGVKISKNNLVYPDIISSSKTPSYLLYRGRGGRSQTTLLFIQPSPLVVWLCKGRGGRSQKTVLCAQTSSLVVKHQVTYFIGVGEGWWWSWTTVLSVQTSSLVVKHQVTYFIGVGGGVVVVSDNTPECPAIISSSKTLSYSMGGWGWGVDLRQQSCVSRHQL